MSTHRAIIIAGQLPNAAHNETFRKIVSDDRMVGEVFVQVTTRLADMQREFREFLAAKGASYDDLLKLALPAADLLHWEREDSE